MFNYISKRRKKNALFALCSRKTFSRDSDDLGMKKLMVDLVTMFYGRARNDWFKRGNNIVRTEECTYGFEVIFCCWKSQPYHEKHNQSMKHLLGIFKSSDTRRGFSPKEGMTCISSQLRQREFILQEQHGLFQPVQFHLHALPAVIDTCHLRQ